MQQKTIILTFYDLGLGGIQTKIISLANYLVKRGVRTVVLLQKHVAGERISLLDERVVLIYTPAFSSNIFKSRYYYYMAFLCYYLKAHCVLVSLEDTAVQILKLRKILPFWKTRVVVNYDILPSAQQKLEDFQLRSILLHADIIIAVSKAVYTDLIQRILLPKDKVIVLYNWFDKINFRGDQSITQRCENKLIFAGRFSKQKQPVEALRVFESVSEKNPGVRMSFYGAGEEDSIIRAAICGSKYKYQIEVNKPVADIAKILQSSGILLLTSVYEGLPFIALEAMAHGCIVAAYAFPGVTEIIIDGKTGVIGNTSEELATKIADLYTHPIVMQKIRTEAIKFQEKKFGARNIKNFSDLLLL